MRLRAARVQRCVKLRLPAAYVHGEHGSGSAPSSSGRLIGDRTGEVNGDPESLLVLDFDAKASGLDALAAWEREYGRIPGWRVHTGSGGLHIYLAGAEGLRSRKLQVLDTGLEVELKANGGYVVFAGSTHENGRLYEPESPRDWVSSFLPPAGSST